MITEKDIDRVIRDIADTTFREPMEWKIIAITTDGRIIADFLELDWEAFIIEEEHISFTKPKKIPKEIIQDWRKYILAD